MNEYYKIEKTEKQHEAMKLVAENKVSLLEGGGRSGKTFIILYIIIVRALMCAGSKHLAARFRFAHIKQAVAFDTMPKLLKLTGLEEKVRLNKSEWYYEFENGSTLWLGGLDDKERTEKILGNEYDTIFLNEASQISYDAYQIIVTRLNPTRGLNGKIIIDYNPPSIKHWGYRIFVRREFPDGRPVPEDNFRSIKINPTDNKFVSKDYVSMLETLSPAMRLRFLKGEYGIDSGALWKRAWIKYNANVFVEELIRVVVAVDPTGTSTGDEAGIVVVGQIGNEEYIVLDDYSMHGTPMEWAKAVSNAYTKWCADMVIAEKNYGGDMVKATIENVHRNINVKLVHASRGKIVRAEPISALYERGMVAHRVPLSDLEDELCTYEEGVEISPNRMDAVVFGLTELALEEMSMLDVI